MIHSILKWAARGVAILVVGLALSNVLLPAIARAQFAASARMSVADILAALVGQSISADSYVATTSTGPGHSCSSQLESCVDLGPGSCNYLGTDSSGRIRLGASCSPEVWIGDGSTKIQPGNVQVQNGGLFLNGTTYIQNLSGSVIVDDADGIKLVTQSSTPSCAAGNAGTFSTLTSSGAPFYCNGTAARQLVTQASWSASLDFAGFGSPTCQDLTIVSSGAVKDEPVVVGGCGSVFAGDIGLTCEGSVTANGTSTIRLCCINATCANLAAITFTVTALR